MLAVMLDMIISMHGTAPVYIILLDVSKAFDRTWREAIWAKMLAQGHPPQVVAAAASLPPPAHRGQDWRRQVCICRRYDLHRTG